MSFGITNTSAAPQASVASFLKYLVAFLAGFAAAMALAILLIPRDPGSPAPAVVSARAVPAPAAQAPEDPDMVRARAAQVQAARELSAISEAAGTTYTPPAIDPSAPIDPALISSDRYKNMDRLTTYAVLIGRGTGCRFDTRPMDDRVRTWIVAAANSRADRDTMFSVWDAGIRANAYAQLEGRSPDDCAAVARGLRGHRWP